MANRTLNRKALRDEAEAAEKLQSTQKPPAKRKAAKRKTRAKEPNDVRLKVFWGVYNQSLKRVATFEYDQREEAEKKVEELSQSGKTPHFVTKVKEVIDEP
jgi:hypothetical protein